MVTTARCPPSRYTDKIRELKDQRAVLKARWHDERARLKEGRASEEEVRAYGYYVNEAEPSGSVLGGVIGARQRVLKPMCIMCATK